MPVLHTVRSDEVVTPIGGDPFAPDALDALFSDTPPVHTHAPTAHHTVARAANNESTEEILPQPKDHFAPEALDSLFDTPKPPAVSGQKADPFSDAALDALFDTPAPPTHPHPQHGMFPCFTFPFIFLFFIFFNPFFLLLVYCFV